MLNSFFKLLYFCSDEDKRSLLKLLALTLLVGILEIAGIASILPFLNLASNPDSFESTTIISNIFGYFDLTSYQSRLMFAGLLILTIFTLSNIMTAMSGWIIQKLGWQLSHTISTRIADTYLHMPFESYMQKEAADLIKSAIADVNNLVNHVLIAGCRFFTSVFVSVAIITFLAVLQPKIAGLAFVLLTGAFLLVFYLRRKSVSDLGKQQLVQNSLRFITFADLLNGNRTIKSSNAQGYFFTRFEKPSRLFSNIQPKLYLSGSLPRYVIETLVFGAIVLFIVFLAGSSHNGFNNAIPIITLFALAAYRLIPSINSAYVSAILVTTHHHVIDNIYNDFSRDIVNKPLQNRSVSFKDHIRLENVSYNYPSKSHFSVSNLHLEIEVGKCTAIVGTSGSGKTTVGCLLVGLLDPTSGSISIDGQLRTNEQKPEWIEKLGYVPQDVFIFNGTIEENIIFGLEKNEERLVMASKIAQSHGFITDTLSDQYKSIVGDNGTRLSGGQKQRIGLARAIYRQPDLLILDEATSALDTKTEKLILDALFNDLTDITIVIIAHRISTVKNCDKLILLDNGQLTCEGTFDELISESELFRELCSYV